MPLPIYESLFPRGGSSHIQLVGTGHGKPPCAAILHAAVRESAHVRSIPTSTSSSNAGSSLSVDMGLSGLGLVLGLAPLLRLREPHLSTGVGMGRPAPRSPLADEGVHAEPGVGCSTCCSCSCWRRSLCSLSRSNRRMPKLMLLVDEALLCTEARLGRREPAFQHQSAASDVRHPVRQNQSPITYYCILHPPSCDCVASGVSVPKIGCIPFPLTYHKHKRLNRIPNTDSQSVNCFLLAGIIFRSGLESDPFLLKYDLSQSER